MKKVLCIMLIAAMVLSLSACGSELAFNLPIGEAEIASIGATIDGVSAQIDSLTATFNDIAAEVEAIGVQIQAVGEAASGIAK